MNFPKIALFQPEIPHNTGALIRLSACFGVGLHIIHPCGFLWDDKHLQRSGLDYHDLSVVVHHPDFAHFQATFPPQAVVLFSASATSSYDTFAFQGHHVLLFGQESSGFPDALKDHYPHHVTIPMLPHCRSMNLALSAAIGISEALRQLKNHPAI